MFIRHSYGNYELRTECCEWRIDLVAIVVSIEIGRKGVPAAHLCLRDE